MPWPQSQEYNEAVQTPDSSFADPELRTGEVVANALGLPIPRSGNFADVYEVRCPNGSRWAIKCFTREVAGLRERYQEISRCLQEARLPFTVEFTYLEKGIRIRGQWFPLLKMQWVEGFTLNEFVRQYLDKPAMFGALLQIWGRMATRLREAGVAHADLQHGNVLMVPGSSAASVAVKLIDYDGMFVPALANKKSGEVGHPSYQHPQRLREGTYSLEVDRFPLLLIATSMRCLQMGGRALWERYDNGDNLLFREADLRTPGESALFRELEGLADPGAAALVGRLRLALDRGLDAAPLLDEVLPELPAKVPAPGTRPSQQSLTTAPTPKAALTRPSRSSSIQVIADAQPVEPVEVAGSDAIATLPRERTYTSEEEAPAQPARKVRRSQSQRQSSRLFFYLAAGIGLALAALILLIVVGGVGFWALSSRNQGKGTYTKVDDNQARAEPKAKDDLKAPLPPKDGAKQHPEAPPKDGAKQHPEAPPKDGAKQHPEAPPKAPDKMPIPVGAVTVRLLDSVPGKGTNYRSLAVSHDGGQVIATTLYDVYRWSVDNGKLTAQPALLHVPKTEMVEAVALSSDGKRALLVHNPKIELWDLGTNMLSQTLPGHRMNNIPDIVFSPDGNLAASSGWDKLVHVWDLKTGAELAKFPGHNDSVHKALFLPDNKRILSIGSDATMRLWEATTGQELHRYQAPEKGPLRELAISADGKRALTNGTGTIRAWDVDSGQELQHFENKNDARDVALSSDGRLAVVFSRGQGRNPTALTFYDVETGKECGQVNGAEYFAHGLAFAGERTLIGSAIDGTLRLWQIEPVR